MTAVRPTVICLTPVKNEAWILERFLQCASTWADHIIIADQGSTDASRSIAASFPKARIISNDCSDLNESQRYRMLIDEARSIPGPRLLIALDADEVLTANWETSPEWQTALRAPAGTVIAFRLVNVAGDVETGWGLNWDFYWGYMDDGARYSGDEFHSSRIPMPPLAPRMLLREIRVLHYAMADLGRYDSRQRWYQCYEVVSDKPRRNVALYRTYHHHEAPDVPRLPLRREWLDGYERRAIDMTSVFREGRHRWDRLVLEFFAEHGTRRFRRVNIWRANWIEVARAEGCETIDARDPRSPIDRLVFRYLSATQSRRNTRLVRWTDQLLHGLGW